MRVIFMGTPDIAVRSLRALHDAGHEILLAVTQPDRPKGRGGKVAMSPVKEAAISMGIPVFQPHKIREEENIEELRQYRADVIVVVAFGQILPRAVLELPKYGCINVHGSLLPKYRGAAPVQWTILNGDPVGGVTTMRMDEGLDTGDMILKKEIAISPGETSGTLFEKVSEEGAQLLLQTLDAVSDGSAQYTPQDPALASKTGMIVKSMGEIRFDRTAHEIDCLIRGMDPWPSAHTRYQGKLLKIWRADALTLPEAAQRFGIDADATYLPGTIIKVTKKEILAAARDSVLLIRELQAEGKKRMDAAAFLRGNAITQGDRFGA